MIIRARGTQAADGTDITGGGEPTNSAQAGPSNLTGTASGSGGTLSFTPPVLPTPTPTNVDEVEPNDSPATAQEVGTNVIVSGSAKSADPGGDGGLGGEDIEDFYSFSIAVPTPVTIDLTDFGNTDFDLLLYTADGPFEEGSAVAFSGEAAGVDEQIVIGVLPAGDYLVGVTAFDDPPITANTDYTLTITAAPKVLRYNVYCGIGSVVPSADTFFATIPGTATSFTIANSPAGASYVVTAVTGSTQSAPSNSATLGACEGGPSITSAKIKLKKKGNLTINGSGFTTGMTILLNGSPLASNYKVKKNGTIIKAKGPLANGQPLSSVVTAGGSYTITIIEADGGCSSFSATAP